ncbi:hypothetical protein AB1K83_14420 [Sporosarcina sp. 179-K 3D1 HS]|uniref:hypothetical protein n=1 Tax=Sporosarcina sp. 179-K 3D1 HS TaxID=3232169 RepID=UPI0039A2FDAC
MITNKDKYPNKEDYEPRGIVRSGELPLSDPSDSNVSDVFRKNELTKTGANKPSAFNENKKESVKEMGQPNLSVEFGMEQPSYTFNKDVHKKWNDLNPKENPVRD